MTIIYHFLVVLGTSFYTFQWDILLVEVGFLTGVCFAPWRTKCIKLKYNEKEESGNEEEQEDVGSWPIRFLLFKLMFTSGVVKIQANCPTWNNLTALEYHFATQCVSESEPKSSISFFFFKQNCISHVLTYLLLFSFQAHWHGMRIIYIHSSYVLV